jgi:L-alanine-DL-glutamate epimerase-like enolase superfamily enzyme
MSAGHVPLNQLVSAVESAVEQVLGKHGAVPVDKLWVGFVAPENLATQENAAKLATALGREAGVNAQPSVAQLSTTGAVAGQAHEAHAAKAGHIIGIVYAPKAQK